MARLHDMEELVGDVLDENVKEYMREALTCYMTGAYRATIVLTYIALFDDIFNKLEQLAKVNKVANKIFTTAAKKRQEQEVFEYELITSLKSTGLMNELESTFLDILRQLRNKSAHPSGHLPSAEEARFIFHEAISRFLSKPILSTTQIVDHIINKLGENNLFHSFEINVMSKVADKEMSNIHEEAIPYLVSKLSMSLEDESLTFNATNFLCAMAYEPKYESTLNIIKSKIIEDKASNPVFYEMICELLSTNGKLYSGLHEVTYGRLNSLLISTIKNITLQTQYDFLKHPITVFISLFEANETKEVLKKNNDAFEALMKKYIYNSYFVEKMIKFISVRTIIGRHLLENASSINFETANEFSKKIHTLDKLISESYTQKFCFQILSSVLSASKHGAFSSESLVNGKFSSLKHIKENAKIYLTENEEEAKVEFLKIIHDHDDLEHLTELLLE